MPIIALLDNTTIYISMNSEEGDEYEDSTETSIIHVYQVLGWILLCGVVGVAVYYIFVILIQ